MGVAGVDAHDRQVDALELLPKPTRHRARPKADALRSRISLTDHPGARVIHPEIYAAQRGLSFSRSGRGDVWRRGRGGLGFCGVAGGVLLQGARPGRLQHDVAVLATLAVFDADDPAVDLRLLQVRRPPLKALTSLRVSLDDPKRYAQNFRPPRFANAVWEAVPTTSLRIDAFRKKPNKDRFYPKHGYRVNEYEPPADMFLLETAPGRVAVPPHQVDPSRRESCAPAMPCMKSLRETGNPYPPEWRKGIITDDCYKPFVRLCHIVWERLQTTGDITLIGRDTEDASVMEIMRATGVTELQSRVEYGPEAVSDTLRDLALWGLVTYERRGHFERRFQLKQHCV
jgi:hypothetical protein